ncbi:dehydrogenase [Paenibacillus swuensis]|uniref:Dehydrogenase n=1 Tax=Paenibacillus swuensis TaxID=1178515 RepID=A0A172TGM3_9BACL|nr:Gfo/Idh/MocA family oxidoreductase [Paenibacillus swuensis]ANE46199.1 dehydrogenase [Paenibacillus swuensis]
MEDIRVGIIGTGFSATFHLEALRRLNYVKVIAIAGTSLVKARQCADQYGIPKAYGDAMELIRDPEVEVIHNCTSNEVHFKYNKEVLLAGKHLLSEKPLAMRSSETAELADLANRSPGISGVCFIYRHFPMVTQARQMLANGEYGKVHLMCGGYMQDWLLHKTDYNWRLHPDKSGVTRAIADIGSHWCDLTQYILCRKITEVFADLQIVHPVRYGPDQAPITVSTEDCGSVLVHFEDGIKGVFTVSQVSAGSKNKLTFDLSAEHGSLRWDQESPNQLWVGRRDVPNFHMDRDPLILGADALSYIHYPGGHQEGWPDGVKNLFLSFYNRIQDRKQGEEKAQYGFATISEGHGIMKIIDAIVESHRTRSWVTVSE